MTERSSRIDDSSKKGAKRETQEQIMKLRERTLELQQENLALRDEIKKLRGEKEAPANLEFSDNVYWFLTESERVGPFCPGCYDDHQRLTTLLDGSHFVGKTRWICPVCNHVFDSET